MLDIETTGLDPKSNEIIEIGAVKVIDRKIVDRFSMLVKPSRSIPPFITRLTGITNDMVEDAKSIHEVMAEFLVFIQDHILIGHNVKFDMSFIKFACERELGVLIDNEVLDNLKYARTYLPHLSHHKLSDCVNYFNLYHENAHRAIDDAIATYEVFEKLRSIAFADRKDEMIEDLLDKHKKLFSSKIRNDGVQLSTYLTKDYMEINANGVVYHYEAFDTFPSSKCDDWVIEDFKILHKSSTVIHAIFVLDQQDRTCRVCSMWKKVKNDWKCYFMQFTRYHS